MSKDSIAQKEQEVKQECEVWWCHDPVFREGLCWYHFLREIVDEWNGEESKEEGYMFGDPLLDSSWWGDDPQEVLA